MRPTPKNPTANALCPPQRRPNPPHSPAITGHIKATMKFPSEHERFLYTMRVVSGGIIGSGLIVFSIGAFGLIRPVRKALLLASGLLACRRPASSPRTPPAAPARPSKVQLLHVHHECDTAKNDKTEMASLSISPSLCPVPAPGAPRHQPHHGRSEHCSAGGLHGWGRGKEGKVKG